MSNPDGRPLKYQTAEELEAAIEEYFEYCDNRIQHIYSPKMEKVIEVIDPAPYTMMGLARRIGLSRQALKEYKDRDQFGDTVKAARDRVQEDVETRLMEKQATGAIFNLKNNFGYVDKTEQDVKTDITTGGEKLASDATVAQFSEFIKQSTKKEDS